MKVCLLLCLIVCIDCRSLGLSWLRRYGGPRLTLNGPPTSLHDPRPGSYAHQWPLHGGPSYNYPVRPNDVTYQQSPQQPPPGALSYQQQKTKILNIMLDHSGHVDADSLFPATHHIPTVFIPSNAPALAPPMVVGYGLYDKRPEVAPPHAHFSMLHPSYESSYTQHHHNEISYFDNPPPQNYKYPSPVPYPVKNYMASGTYSSVAHHGQSNQQVRPPNPPHPHQHPQQSYLPENPSSVPVPAPSHQVPELSIPPYSPQPPPPPPSYSSGNNVYEVGYLHPSPAHFSHNNPLGAPPCCEDIPWTPVESASAITPMFREHRLYPTTRHPMRAYLPIKGHHVESESRPYITVLTVSNATATAAGHRPNDTVTSTQTPLEATTVATKDNTPMTIVMLSSPNVSTSLPAALPTRSSLPKLKNTTSFLGGFLASITVAPGIHAFDVRPKNLTQADSTTTKPTTTTTTTKPTTTTTTPKPSSSPTPDPPTTTRRPPVRARPVRPTQSDDIFGFPDDIFPSDGHGAGTGAASDAAGSESGGMVNIFTSFLDELANIIEQFSPTDLPGVASDVGGAAGETANTASQVASEAGAAAGDVGGAFGEVGGAVGQVGGAVGEVGGAIGEAGGAGLGGFTDTAGGIAGGFGEGLGGVAEGAAGVPEGMAGGVAAGNEIPASSQISANSVFNSLLRQPQPEPGMGFDGMPFGPQFGANFNGFDMGESAEAEGFRGFFDDSLGAVSHAESEPVAEASHGIQDHFIEIPISELVPHPSFLRNNIAMSPFSEAEPHPVITNLGRPKDFEVDHFGSAESSDDDQIASATENNYQVGQLPLDSAQEHQKPSNHDAEEGQKEEEQEQEVKASFSTVSPVSNHLDLRTTSRPKLPMTKKNNHAIPWPKVTDYRSHYLNSLLAQAAEVVSTESPEIISFSSTVSHWPQYGSKVTKGRANHVELLATAVGQDKSSSGGDDQDGGKTPKALLMEPTPKTNIRIKSELGAVRNNNANNDLSSFGHTERSLASPEVSTIRDYHSRTTESSEEKDNVPDAEGIPANILPEVQSNINLDLLRTEYSERGRRN